MKYALSILLLVILFSSCATLLNEKTTKIKIYTSKPSKIIIGNDTLFTKKDRASVTTKRKNSPLPITFVTDSLTKTIGVDPINSFAYYVNILYNYGIGLLIDKNNDKRYGYPKSIQVNLSDTSTHYRTHLQNQFRAGDLFLHLGLPYINNFALKPEGEGRKIHTGFFGFGIGLDYYHQKKQYLSFNTVFATHILLPIPVPLHLAGEHALMTSWYFALNNNHRLGRFTLGYGLTYARHSWTLTDYGTLLDNYPDRKIANKKHNAAGLLISSYYELSRDFNLGIVYKPSFWRPNIAQSFQYEHLISLDLAWKIRLN